MKARKHELVAYGRAAVRRGRVAALAVAAPFIGLGFVIVFPIVGLGMLLWMAAPGLARSARSIGVFARNVALFLAAPFVGLAYALAFPFIGIALLVHRAARTMLIGHGAA